MWAPFYAWHYGPHNFLWFCDIANFMILLGLWHESRFVLSWQAVSVLLVQLLWTGDLAGRLLFGVHPIGGSEYMFEPEIPLVIRLLSLFHALAPVILLWGVARLGYDRRAFITQSLVSWVVLPVSFLAGPERDINWTWGPFDKPQAVLPPASYLLVCMISYPLLLYLPTHLAFQGLESLRRRRGAAPGGGPSA